MLKTFNHKTHLLDLFYRNVFEILIFFEVQKNVAFAYFLAYIIYQFWTTDIIKKVIQSYRF